jgi:hypothetical protein
VDINLVQHLEFPEVPQNMKQKVFFDENDRLNELSKIGDPLERLNTSCYAGLTRTPKRIV